MVYVACSGGIGGGSTPLCSRTRYTTYCASRSGPQYRRLCIRSRSAMHTPVDVTGFEPAKASLQNLGLPNPLSAHPTILFWLGNLTQWRADGRPFASL